MRGFGRFNGLVVAAWFGLLGGCGVPVGTKGEPCNARGLCGSGLACVSGLCEATGTSPTDAGTSPTDAGTSPTDAGTSPTDAGTSPTDAGTVAADMVDVPAGSFIVGCNAAVSEACSGGQNEQLPAGTESLEPFRIDRTEVTAGAYDVCVSEGACTAPSCTSASSAHPVVCVDWYQATAFCAWRGARLPTELEWEKAARGTNGQIWPTGNTAPTCAQANIGGCDGAAWPAGSQPGAASPYGALDMAGNVLEWTDSWYAAAQQYRVIRGGVWRSDARNARASLRPDGRRPSEGSEYIGLRCAQSY